MRTTMHRRVAALATPLLALSGLAVTGAPPATAVTHDPAPVSAGAAWATSQLTNDLLTVRFGGTDFPDYGLSADLAISLAEVGGHGATVTAISNAVAADIETYVGDGTVESYAGALGKAAVLAEAAGADPASYGGVDLVARLEGRVGTSGATAGRIADASAFGDFANVIGQAYAVQALDEAGSSLTGSATDFLLEQQCAAGWFRLDFSDPGDADQSCDGDSGAMPDTDVTAFAVLLLRTQAADPDVSAALASAVTWMQSSQKADGSFGGGTSTEAANANSTGLAGWALGERGATVDAEQAATWLRQHQLANAGTCLPYAAADRGALAYNDAARSAAAAHALTPDTRDQYVRATAQALPALEWAAAGAGTVAPTLPTKQQFSRPGDRVTLEVTTANPGDVVCFALSGQAGTHVVADATGRAAAAVALPAGTEKRLYDATDSAGVVGSFRYLVLDKAKLKVKPGKAAVERGKAQTIKVAGLENKEKVKVFVDGKKVGKGKADRDGKFRVRFVRSLAPGKHKVKVVGQFPDRKGKATYRVVR
jgi:hypothetical protein